MLSKEYNVFKNAKTLCVAIFKRQTSVIRRDIIILRKFNLDKIIKYGRGNIWIII